MDPIERILDSSVTEMTASELVTYMRVYLQQMYDVEMPVDGMIDRKTIEALQSRYGREKAGRIVQWVMLRHGGRKDGEYVTTSLFSKRMKWYTDKMWLEYQQDAARRERTERNRVAAESEFVGIDALL